MTKFALAILVLVTVAVVAADTGSRFTVEPHSPAEDESFHAVVLIGSGPAGFCIRPFPNVQNERFDVVLEGQTIYLDVSIEDLLTVCVPGLPPLEQRYLIPGVPAGDYQLVFSTVIQSTSFPASEDDRTFRESINFEVLPGPQPVPAINFSLMAVLGLIVFLIGWKLLRTQSSSD